MHAVGWAEEELVGDSEGDGGLAEFRVGDEEDGLLLAGGHGCGSMRVKE